MTVRVVHGVNDDRLSLEGRTVGFAAENLRDVFNIPAEASALLNGEAVGTDAVLRSGDSLEFVRQYGWKGAQEYWSEKELIQHLGRDVVQKMKDAGLKLMPQPVLTATELSKWIRWLSDQSRHPSDLMHVEVSIEEEWIAVEGKQFPTKQNEAAIVQCLLDANGELRSQSDMKNQFPQYILEERVDNTIRRSLKGHASGIGKLIHSDHKGFRLNRQKIEQPLTQ